MVMTECRYGTCPLPISREYAEKGHMQTLRQGHQSTKSRVPANVDTVPPIACASTEPHEFPPIDKKPVGKPRPNEKMKHIFTHVYELNDEMQEKSTPIRQNVSPQIPSMATST